MDGHGPGTIYDCIVLGAGPGGLQASIHLGRYNFSVLLFHKQGGRTSHAKRIENFLGHKVISGTELLETGLAQDDPKRVDEGWEAVKTIVGRIRKLVHNILFFAKEREFNPEATDLVSFAYDVAASVESKIKAAGIGFDCQFDSDPGSISLDAGVVRLALINILENALDACVEDTSKKSHRIVFSLKPEAKHIAFKVSDNGIGMDRETLESLFTLFFSSKGNKGTGLGLFIADKVIKQHGGKIKVESKPNRGSSFRIIIPRKFSGQINRPSS